MTVRWPASRALRWGIGIPAGLAGLFGVVLIGDALHRLPRIPSTANVRPSVVDDWTPPWEPTAPAADGALPRRWVLIGWDGATWDLILPMIERGKLPNLASLMRRGAYGALASFQPTLSPVMWTTVATGMPPETHGILGFDVPRSKLEKRIERLKHWGKLKRRLYTNTDRRVRSIWNLMSDAGRPVLVAGYHNTYPAEDVRGLMVSNYLMQDLMSEMMHASGGVDPEQAEALVHPVEELPGVLEIESGVRVTFRKSLSRFADLDPDQVRALVSGSGLDPEVHHRLFFLRQAFLGDTFDAEVVDRYFDRVRPDLTMVHFQAIDIASHYFLYFSRPELYATLEFPPAERAKLDAERRHYERTVEAFHDYLDEWLGKLLDRLPDDIGVMIVSDHGFGPVANEHRPGGHEDAPPGIIVIAGPGVQAGARLRGATLYDVFPTLAVALGLPLSQQLPGHPLAEAFAPGRLDLATVATVPTYETSERYVPKTAPPEALGRELEKQLRSLGYLK